MKRVIISILICGFALLSYAQKVQVKTFELEPFIGATFGTSDFRDYNNKIGPTLGLEARWNLKNIPLDIGAQLYAGSAVYSPGYRKSNEDDISCCTFSTTAFIDYNFQRGTNVSLFVGLGLGINNYNILNGDDDNTLEDNTFGIGLSPRIGIEFFRHLRMTLTGHFDNNIYNTVGLSVGYSFGAGKRISQERY